MFGLVANRHHCLAVTVSLPEGHADQARRFTGLLSRRSSSIGFGLSLEQRVSLRAVLDGTQGVLPR